MKTKDSEEMAKTCIEALMQHYIDAVVTGNYELCVQYKKIFHSNFFQNLVENTPKTVPNENV